MVRSLLSAIGLSALLLIGCAAKDSNYNKAVKVESPKSYFAELPTAYQDTQFAIKGDFNGDGHLDFICSQIESGHKGNKRIIYFFQNDGEGNFKLRRCDDENVQRAE